MWFVGLAGWVMVVAASAAAGAVRHPVRTLLCCLVAVVSCTLAGDGLSGPGGYSLARIRYQKGTIEPLATGWRLRWRDDEVQDDGSIKRVQRKMLLGTYDELPTKPLARRAADRVLGRLNALDYVPGRTATVATFAEQWEREVLPTMKPSTQASARSHLRAHILPRVGALPLEAVQPQRAQALATDLLVGGVSRKTVKNVLMTLGSVLRTAREWGYSAGTLGRVKLPPAPPDDARVFTIEEATAIIEAAAEPWRTLFLTAALTGLRLGELLGLRWGDVDLGARTIAVVQSVWQGKLQTPKTARSVRHVPIPGVLADALAHHRARWRPNDLNLLWANRNGGPVCADNLRARVLKPLLARLGIAPAGFHAFRHLQGTLLVATGANAKIAQAQLGHSDVRTTLQLYAHVIQDDHRKAVESVAARLRPVAPRGGLRLVRVK